MTSLETHLSVLGHTSFQLLDVLLVLNLFLLSCCESALPGGSSGQSGVGVVGGVGIKRELLGACAAALSEYRKPFLRASHARAVLAHLVQCRKREAKLGRFVFLQGV